MKKALLTFAAILWVTLDSKACVCGDYEYKEHLKFATHVFIGEAIHNVGPDSTVTQEWDKEGYGATVKFKIKHILKGEVVSDYVVIDQRGNGDCSIGYKFGEEYLIFATDTPKTPPLPDFVDLYYLSSDSIFEETYDLEKAEKRIEDYFNNLKTEYQFMYTSYCNSFNDDSKYYQRAIKNIR